jgi:hypothetical protein
MTDTLLALAPADQPQVTQLTRECRVISPRTITGRNWQSQVTELTQRVTQLFKLTGDTRLAGYMD